MFPFTRRWLIVAIATFCFSVPLGNVVHAQHVRYDARSLQGQKMLSGNYYLCSPFGAQGTLALPEAWDQFKSIGIVFGVLAQIAHHALGISVR